MEAGLYVLSPQNSSDLFGYKTQVDCFLLLHVLHKTIHVSWKLLSQPTSADDSGILIMATVSVVKVTGQAVSKRGLGAKARNIIQPDWVIISWEREGHFKYM